MLKRPGGKSCEGQDCDTCRSRPACDFIAIAARWECEARLCPKRNTPGQCLCMAIMPTVLKLEAEYFGEGVAQ